MRTHIFKTQLLRVKSIQREIEVPDDFSLYKLAEAVINAYGFDFDHAFGFFSTIGERYFDSDKKYELFADMEDEGIEPTGAKSVKKTKVREVWKRPKDQMLFLFDYGDDWRWIVTLERFDEKQHGATYPRVLSSKGEPPEQYPDADEE